MSALNLSDLSMMDLFRLDAEGQIQALTSGLLALERNPKASDQLEICMRAAHSLKGAARIAGIEVGVRVAHTLEECFVGAQRGAITLQRMHIDALFQTVDLLSRIANTPDAAMSRWDEEKKSEADAILATLTTTLKTNEVKTEPTTVSVKPSVSPPAERETVPLDEQAGSERVLRVTANHLNRLLGLAGESLVESRWLKPFAETLLRLKRLHDDTDRRIDGLRDILSAHAGTERMEAALNEVRNQVYECREILSQRILELQMFDSRATNLAHRLYDSALACRMRPFADGVKQLPRMVRDLGHTLRKQVRLEILGERTQVDRDILERLDAPLGHLISNALDHGIEPAAERRIAGKAEEGLVRIEARHNAGVLQISVSDDGRGIDLDKLRATIVERNLVTAEIASRLDETELLEFLFLPGFTTADIVTEISGRGVGLDVVQDVIKQVRGSIRVSTQFGKGTRFQMQLPLTLSVVRTLLVEIGGEAYAFPLAHIVRTIKISKQDVQMLEGREHFNFEGCAVGLVSAQQIFGGPVLKRMENQLSIIVIGDPACPYGLVADRFLGERELVVQPLDPRLGKIKDIAAAALMEDGSPALIVDIDDLLRSVDKLVAGGRLDKVERRADHIQKTRSKRILVVEDSLTVRELERKLLDHAGYEVEVAVDGMDGWNAARTGLFNLVITDIDMPRMDGIELVKLIKKDPHLKSIPVLIVSYKDREEDRSRGLEAGADYYVTKGSFQDDTLLRAVVDLIGDPAT